MLQMTDNLCAFEVCGCTLLSPRRCFSSTVSSAAHSETVAGWINANEWKYSVVCVCVVHCKGRRWMYMWLFNKAAWLFFYLFLLELALPTNTKLNVWFNSANTNFWFIFARVLSSAGVNTSHTCGSGGFCLLIFLLLLDYSSGLFTIRGAQIEF